jgi:hypothetical protein
MCENLPVFDRIQDGTDLFELQQAAHAAMPHSENKRQSIILKQADRESVVFFIRGSSKFVAIKIKTTNINQ